MTSSAVPTPGLDKKISAALKELRWQDARNLLEEKLLGTPKDIGARQKLTSVLIRTEQWEAAVASAHEQLALQPDDVSLIKKAIMLGLKHGNPLPRSLGATLALRLAERILCLDTQDGALLRLAGQALALHGRKKEAVGVLRRALQAEPDDFFAHVLLSELLWESGDPVGSADVFEGVLQLRPDDVRLWRTAASTRLRAGRPAESIAAHRRSVELRRPSMPATFEKGLRDLSGSPVRLSRERLDWIWSLRQKHGLDRTTSYDEWARRVQVGMDTEDLTLNWLEVFPDRWNQVAEQTQLQGVPVLEQALRRGRGAYIAVAHLGPVLAMPCSLLAARLPFRWISSASAVGGGEVYGRLISPNDQKRRAALPAVYETLLSNKILLAAADTDGRRPPQVPFEGQLLRVNQTIIHLAHACGAATFFMDGRWEGGKTVFRVLPMVVPEAGEAASDYASRWTQDYLARVRALLLSDPVNLKCRGGLWESLSFAS